MQLMKNKIILAIITVILVTCVLESEEELIPWNQPRHFCGSSLSETLQKLCKGKYVNPDSKQQIKCRPKRRVVDECCIKPCTLQHLHENYCENDCEMESPLYLDTSLKYVPRIETKSQPNSLTTAKTTTTTTTTKPRATHTPTFYDSKRDWFGMGMGLLNFNWH